MSISGSRTVYHSRQSSDSGNPSLARLLLVSYFLGKYRLSSNSGIHTVPTEPGIILISEQGDPVPSGRPTWAKDSSFLVFRRLQQFVPEFNEFLAKNPIPDKG